MSSLFELKEIVVLTSYDLHRLYVLISLYMNDIILTSTLLSHVKDNFNFIVLPRDAGIVTSQGSSLFDRIFLSGRDGRHFTSTQNLLLHSTES